MAKKGARSSGTGGQSRSTKDKEMAAELKRRGIRRNHARCPICNKVVGLTQFYKHISFHR